ncbi:MAG: hypothetical protein U0572_15855 [Phycisphaerales bacterium]
MSHLRSVAAAAVLASASSALADIVASTYTNSSNYHYKVTHMPDLDQKRLGGLPGDGAMYCVPTSTMNLFAYAANHGYPFLDPGQANWQAQANYNTATARLMELGFYMGTTAGGGTGGQGWKDGVDQWLALYGAGIFCQMHFWNSSDYSVRAYKIAKKATQGSIVAFAYGRYEIVGNFEGLPLLNRNGGHAVTLTEAFHNADQKWFRYRDPADDSYDTDQSQFVNKEVSITAVTYATLPLPGYTNTLTAIDYPSSDGKIRFIDEFVCLRPMFGLAYANTGGTFKLTPQVIGSLGGTQPQITLNAPAFGIADLFHDADGDDALVLVNTSAAAGLTQLRRVDMATGEQTPVGSFTGLKRFCVARDGLIYAHDGLKLYCIKPDGTLGGSTSDIPTPTAIGYDDKQDHIIILSVPQRKIVRLSKTFNWIGSFDVPTLTPMSGDGSVIVNPFDGAVYFDTDASNSLHRLVGNGPIFSFTSISVPGLTGPKGLGSGDDGALYVSAGGLLKVVRQGRSGGWAIDPSSPFNGLPCSNRMSMLHSRNNFDPAQHSGPGWNTNILPEDLLDIGVTVADCLGDLDGDGDVDAADIARLLGNWGGTDPNYDLNADGIVGSADLGIVLGGWGVCP